MTKKILRNSIGESFRNIWNHKLLFSFLIFLQLSFFVSLFLINYSYVPKMLNNLKEIDDYLLNQKLDDESVMNKFLARQPLLGENVQIITTNFNEMIRDFRIFIIFIVADVIVFLSLSWALTQRLVYKLKFAEMKNIFLKILAISSAVLGAIAVMFLWVFNLTISELISFRSRFMMKFFPVLIISLVLLYFMFIALSLAHKVRLKDIIGKAVYLGIKKVHYALPLTFLVGFFLLLLLYSLSAYFEESVLLLILPIIIAPIILVFGRILKLNLAKSFD